ncbi:hypothetical protein [Marisediminicola senii]|uniref:hypothetical protein n=1 Tax=Marisediminicola senii TaxID=2711233 RepID=UPI0013ED53D6|nr:hypothetical protein [Marisediminicola senii]
MISGSGETEESAADRANETPAVLPPPTVVPSHTVSMAVVTAPDSSAAIERDATGSGSRRATFSPLPAGAQEIAWEESSSQADASTPAADAPASAADGAAAPQTLTRRQLRALRAQAEAEGRPAPVVQSLATGIFSVIPPAEADQAAQADQIARAERAAAAEQAAEAEYAASGGVVDAEVVDADPATDGADARTDSAVEVEVVAVGTGPDAAHDDVIEAEVVDETRPGRPSPFQALFFPRRRGAAAAAAAAAPAAAAPGAADETPADEAPANKAPADEAPAGEASTDTAPANAVDVAAADSASGTATDGRDDVAADDTAAAASTDVSTTDTATDDGFLSDEEQADHIEPAPLDAIAPFGEWPAQDPLTAPESADAATELPVTTGAITTNALVLPTVPAEQGDAVIAPLTSTGEVLLTGSIDLPRTFGSTGAHPVLFDHPDVDALIDANDRDDVVSDAAPVRAVNAVSSASSSGSVIESPMRPASRLPLVIGLAAIAAVLITIGVVVGVALDIL